LGGPQSQWRKEIHLTPAGNRFSLTVLTELPRPDVIKQIKWDRLIKNNAEGEFGQCDEFFLNSSGYTAETPESVTKFSRAKISKKIFVDATR
jgi:hypothetical protein